MQLTRRSALLACLITAVPFLNAQTKAPLRVLSSNGIAAVIEHLKPELEKAVGQPLSIEFSASASLKPRIEGGEAFDVAILTPAQMADLAKQGKVVASSNADIARAGVGVGVKSGARKPDVSTPEAFKATMLKAKSVTYTENGQSRVAIDKAFEKLGIADAMRPKIILKGPGGGPIAVAAGEAEIVLTLSSEILPVKGVRYVGPLPKDLQNYVTFTAGISAASKNETAAKKLVQYLAKPSVATMLKAHGMEPPSGH
jgi:molybdate transport system substrate-binding protein